MSTHAFFRIFPIILFAALAFGACNSDGGEGNGESGGEPAIESKRAGINEVILIESADFDGMNPITSTRANAQYVHPILAVSRPEIEKIEEGEYAGGLAITYEIRPEAKWDDGKPITAHDAVFSLKAIKNPKTDAEHVRGYLEFIDHVEIDPENDRKLTIYCNDRYFMSEIWSSLTPMPEHIYDSEGLMRKFTVKELNDPANKEKLSGNPDIIKFAEAFNSEKHNREKGYVVGSGPYAFESWETGQRLTLARKKNWWGDKLQGKVKGFEAFPDKITWEVITDNTTALSAMKDEAADVLDGITSKDYLDQKEDEQFTQLYNLHAPVQLSYLYIGMNMKRPKLADKRVRQALCHLVNREQIIDVLYYGLAVPVNGPIHPIKDYYHDGLEPYDYSIEKARKLLEEAGWKDTNGDGVRDKDVQGKQTPLKLELKYVSGSSTGEKIALMFKKSAEKAGVSLELVQKEWTVFIDESKTHQFDMFMGGWVQAPVLDDPKQIWHTQSYDGGSNYVGFGNERSDELIENIRYELDEEKRNQMYLEFQEILHEEAPYIFLLSSRKKLFIHARFDNANPKGKRPGYVVNAFKLNPNFGKRAQLAH